MSECYGCSYETTCKKYTGGMPGQKVEVELCKLCANTLVGNSVFFPTQYPNADILKIVCYVGNTILEALKP